MEKPKPASNREDENHYCFERTVTFRDGDGNTSTNNIDLYKRDCFLLEAKQEIRTFYKSSEVFQRPRTA